MHPTFFLNYTRNSLTSELSDFNNDLCLDNLNTGVKAYNFKNVLAMSFAGVDLSWGRQQPDVLYGHIMTALWSVSSVSVPMKHLICSLPLSVAVRVLIGGV